MVDAAVVRRRLPAALRDRSRAPLRASHSAGYYVRPGRGTGASTFLVELEGGGWCTSDEDCASRAKSDLGSSRSWPKSGSPTMDGGSHGLFSNNCTVNSKFCNATMVHVNYCDGGSFAGHVDAPVNASGTLLYFRGRDVLDAALAALAASEGMAAAAAVVLKGCSAGGLAVILHADHVAGALATLAPGAAVVAVPDAGYFLDHNDTKGKPSYTPLYKWVAETQNVTAGGVDAGCVAHYAPTGDSWRCFMAEYAAPFLTTPSFFAQDLDDSWQMTNIFKLGCSPYHGPGDCTAAQLADVTRYREDTLAALAPVLANPAHGGFFTACVQHCHANLDACFTQAVVQAQTMQETLWAWYASAALHVPPPAGAATVVIDGPGLSNPTCTASCSPYRV